MATALPASPLPSSASRSGARRTPSHLTVGVVQLSLETDLTANRDKIVRFVHAAAAAACRVVVFPETALATPPETPMAARDAAADAVRRAAAEAGVYVVVGMKYRRVETAPLNERLLVIGLDGRIVQTYDKRWQDHDLLDFPGPFEIDGVPCAATICADRWLRGIEELPAMAGARILIECSNNYRNEWIADLGWYWYVPRALRNGVYVVFANTPWHSPGQGVPDHGPGHGHSAIIAPDGELLAAAGEEPDRLLVATLELSRATAATAWQRRRHPVLRPFWEAGVRLLRGEAVPAPEETPLLPPLDEPVDVSIAAAQMACSDDLATNLARMRRLIGEARAGGADVVVFPELAVTGPGEVAVRAADAAALDGALAELRGAAAEAGIATVFGMPALAHGVRTNCVYVIGPDGALLARHAQVVVDRPELFAPGAEAATMWWSLKGVPAVVSVGAEALWSELAELAAVRGALIHLQVCNETETSAAAALLRRQRWACLASFRTLTATVNAASPAGPDRPGAPGALVGGGSIIWEDFFRAHSGRDGGWAPHSAVRLAEAGAGEALLFASQRVPVANVQLAVVALRRTRGTRTWWETGARAVAGPVPTRTPPVAMASSG